MIGDTGYTKYCIWEHSASTKELYAQRVRGEVPEMECHVQAIELLTPHLSPGDSVLDVGCGTGYFYRSLQRRSLDVRYIGIDSAPSLIALGQEILPAHGLPPTSLRAVRIEDLEGEIDHVVCINVLSNIDNYHRPLERLLQLARKSVILRESVDPVHARYQYVKDKYLDPGIDLYVHVNTYPQSEFEEFVRTRGFDVSCVTDRRTGGAVEYVIDYPHYWKFFLARRIRSMP